MLTAKVFHDGKSQVVRLPKDLHFGPGTHEVSIRREGEALILEPLEREEWPEAFWQAFGGMPEGFERPKQICQEREDA